jgi:cytochrome c oxidase subunit 6a
MLGLRTATRASQALPAFRNTAARRWTSGIGAKGFEGAADNAFNRERAAVKQHAADTSGKWHEGERIWRVVLVWRGLHCG